MSTPKNARLHILTAIAILILGIVLRFWGLDSKPLWLDEAITGLMGLGHTYENVPLEALVPLNRLVQVFTLQPETTCPQIAQTLALQSTHPPLFFCLMHGWLSGLRDSDLSLAWQLRALPALFGAIAIAAIYALNRVAFSPTAGLAGAAVMAVSPFAIYLSQEARHYTLPMVLIALALLALVQIQRDLFPGNRLQRRRLRPWVWVGWVAVNAIALYVHYFCLLSFAAQVITLSGSLLWQRDRYPDRQGIQLRYAWRAVILATLGVLLLYLPWWPILFSHFNRPETSWVPPPYNVSPFYQLLAGWLLMVVALPVEKQPLAIAAPAGLLMLSFGLWLGRLICRRWRQLWCDSTTSMATLALFSFTVCVVLEYLAIAYLLGKDLTSVPRYNFVYYPGVCALLGASLSPTQPTAATPPSTHPTPSHPQANPRVLPKNAMHQRQRSGKSAIKSFCVQPIAIVVLVGIVSSVVVVSGLAFLKPYAPQQVARDITQETVLPLEVVVSYRDWQDIALGLSFALAIRQRQLTLQPHQSISWAFLSRIEGGYDQVWHTLAQLPQPVQPPLNLWIVAPKLKRKHYPLELSIAADSNSIAPATRCTLDAAHHYRIGIPYQLYRCE